MKIKGFGIKNYRSFNEEGVFLDDIKKINIIIGKNNSGKSNVLRYLKTLGQNIDKFSNFPIDIENQFRRNSKSSSIILKISGEEANFYRESTHIRNRQHVYLDFLKKDHKLEFVVPESKITTLPSFFDDLNQQELSYFQNTYSSANIAQFEAEIIKHWTFHASELIKDVFKSIIYIPHLRIIQEGHRFGDSNSSIDGSNIISEMFQMQNPTIGKEDSKKRFQLIRDFVRELIDKPDLEIEIPHTKDQIILTLDNNRLPLESFGTGIHQLVLLSSVLVIHENSIVCIEEPEIHLHPELQRKLFRFLLKTNNVYFITTHSNIFLDSVNDTSVYHVKYDGIKSVITKAENTSIAMEIIDDLGYRPSDILQANGIIWVEGPSDRTYILKWISIYDSTLIEGIHFIIMFYGGRLLSHLTFDASQIVEELIPLFKMNKNAFVVIDRDDFSKKNAINPTKELIKTEIGEDNSWITKGREIENYLSEATINKWTKKSSFKHETDIKIEDSIKKIAPNLKYETNKSKFSKEIINHITKSEMNILDLEKQISKLIGKIRNWNGK